MESDNDLKGERLDPAALDITEKRKRPRKRKRPAPRAELQEWSVAAEARARARPIPPGIILEPAGFDKEHWTAPHSDIDIWTLQLADAFGTRSQAVISLFMHQLQALCRQTHWDEKARQWRISENEYSAILGIVSTTKPRNELEAAQAAQMVAVHLLTMKVAARAIKYEYEPRTVANVAKLAKAFAGQIETFRAGRGRKPAVRQSIKVTKETHQHVHYHDHRGGERNERQPHERARSLADQLDALPSPDPARDAVPLPGNEGAEPLQAPRRG